MTLKPDSIGARVEGGRCHLPTKIRSVGSCWPRLCNRLTQPGSLARDRALPLTTGTTLFVAVRLW